MSNLEVEMPKAEDRELKQFSFEVEARSIARVALLDEDEKWALFRKLVEEGQIEVAGEL